MMTPNVNAGYAATCLFTCPMLMQQGHCLVYGRCRPEACKTFPIDQRDLDKVKLCSGSCGFHFGTEQAETTGKAGEP